MTKRLGAALKDGLAWTGLPRLVHQVAWPGRLSILMYHAVVSEPLAVSDWCFLDLDSFRRQMDYLARYLEVLPLSAAVERLREGSLRRPAAVITFDDGYQNNRDVAWPELRERRLPATIFLTTALAGTDDTVWHCRLNRALAATGRNGLAWAGERFELSTAASRAAASSTLQARLKTLPHPQLLAALRDILRALEDDPDRPVEPGSPYRMLSREAIAEMRASGLVEFGAHTRRHTILAGLPPREREEEIEGSLAAVEELTGEPCRLFSYPNGRPEDFDEATIATLRARGVRAAVTTVGGPNDAATPGLELRRYGIGAGTGPGAFVLAVHHCARKGLRRAAGG